jgi:hypothetical protein
VRQGMLTDSERRTVAPMEGEVFVSLEISFVCSSRSGKCRAKGNYVVGQELPPDVP